MESSENGLVGFELIEDYVHPSPKGHSLIAWNLWREMAEAQWIDGVESADRAVFDRVVATRPSLTSNRNAVWHYNQGVILENRDHFEQAIAKYRQAIEIDPNYWGALQNLGLLLRQQGEAVEALEMMRRAVALRPEYVGSLLPFGDLLRSSGRLDAALETFRQVAANSNGAAAHLGIGQVTRGWDRTMKRRLLRAAMVLEPELAKPQILFGHLMIRNGDVKGQRPTSRRRSAWIHWMPMHITLLESCIRRGTDWMKPRLPFWDQHSSGQVTRVLTTI